MPPAELARAAGARVVCLSANIGKGGAVAAGIAATPDADVYLLLDADIGATAGAGAFPAGPGARRRGRHDHRRAPERGPARWLRAGPQPEPVGDPSRCGFVAAAPLSGQRAVRADLLRSLEPAARFGLEVGLTIDAVRQGARVLEVPVALEHRHTGRKLSGFTHRGRQGTDIVRALWPRLSSAHPARP